MHSLNRKTEAIVLEPPAPRTDALLAGTILQLGYPGPEAVCGNMFPQIHRSLDACLQLARPKTLCRSTPFESLEKKTICGSGLCLETVNWSRLATRMSKIRELCCFAVTLGDQIDQTIRRLNPSDMVQAFMLDAAASVLAEQYADQIHRQILGHYERLGLQASARFSPGYCDWPIEKGQAAIVAFLKPQAIGIHAAATGLMTPRKSVTAAVIAAETMPEQSPCFLCAKECAHRRAPYAGTAANRADA